MELQYYGANCVVLTTKDARIVIDDTLASHGAKSVTKEGDIALFTGRVEKPAAKTKITIGRPGEYEISNVSITGMPARAHMDEEGQSSATMYQIIVGEVTLLFTGHIYPELSADQLEDLNIIDVMVVPVGGHGYTMDAEGALKLIKEVEPKAVIPTHYDQKGITYEVPQATLEEAVKELGLEAADPISKYKIKKPDLPETTQLVVLERS
jgi:L-ascorbate metabolism protein UlaG (beta-lactamase superfamily)